MAVIHRNKGKWYRDEVASSLWFEFEGRMYEVWPEHYDHQPPSWSIWLASGEERREGEQIAECDHFDTLWQLREALDADRFHGPHSWAEGLNGEADTLQA